MEDILVVAEHLRFTLKEFTEPDEQVVEVHGVGGLETELVLAVDSRHVVETFLAAVFFPLCPLHTALADIRVLDGRDTCLHGVRLVDLLIECQFLDDLAQDGFLVLGVVDGEVARIAESFGFLAQDTTTDGVERAHPKVARIFGVHQSLDTLLHLAGGLIGKGKRENTVSGNTLLEQVGDLIG